MTVPVSRRDFLRITGLGGTLAALAACNPLRSDELLEAVAASVPTAAPILDPEGMILHTLRRLTFGPTAAELSRASRLGLEAWFEEQLEAGSSDTPEVEDRLAEFATLEMSAGELRGLEENGRVARELGASAVVRQIYSPNQLFEVMVDFWTNHFNIYAYSPPELFLEDKDDREVIRAHALGSFPDMLAASAHSPAMLVDLDNAQSRQPSPNENYARELLELHSLGVDGGYTYNDIQAVARAFTGWAPRLAFAPPGSPPSSDLLVCVFLRGGIDGLNAVIPHFESEYYDARTNLAIAEPTAGSDATSIELDDRFSLHPSLRPLLDPYLAGELAIIHACGSPDPTPSHFDAMDLLSGLDPTNYQPSDGAVYPEDEFGLGLSQIALLAKSELGLEIACVDVGGWDTHVQQGAGEGRMPQLMASLAGGLAAFHKDMRAKMSDVTVVTMSEFGRRLAENGGGGTDHGHGALCL